MSGRPKMAEIGVEQTQHNMNRFKEPTMAAAAGIGAALIIATLPHVYLENIIGASGLSEIVPAAAPPLGNTARGLIAAMAGLVSASAIYFFLNRKGGSDMGVALREQINAASPIETDFEEEANARKSRFSLPKLNTKSLTKFLKKPKKDKARVMDLSDLPQLRKVDSKPEQSARPSIFTEAEAVQTAPLPQAIRHFEEGTSAEPMPIDIPSAPTQAQPLSDVIPSVETATDPQQPGQAPAPIAKAAVVEVPAEDLSDLNIAQLADRLESGLRRLKQLEAGSATAAEIPAQTAVIAEPVAGPVSETPVLAQPQLREVEKSPEDVAAVRQADMDAALKAALGTLEKMTAQR